MNIYNLCRQTVTVYRAEGDTISRRVLPRVFLEFRGKRKTDRVGLREDSSFLLVVPGEEQAVALGDKVVPGEGPELTKAQWASLTDCCIVRWAEQKYFDGKSVHTEAGG